MPSTIGFSHFTSCVELGNTISYALKSERDLLLYLEASISCSPYHKELCTRLLGAWGIFDPMSQMSANDFQALSDVFHIGKTDFLALGIKSADCIFQPHLICSLGPVLIVSAMFGRDSVLAIEGKMPGVRD